MSASIILQVFKDQVLMAVILNAVFIYFLVDVVKDKVSEMFAVELRALSAAVIVLIGAAAPVVRYYTRKKRRHTA